MAFAAHASLAEVPILVSQHLSCSICLDLFTDPVTTTCGHTFCQCCLDRNLHYNDLVCPLCKAYMRKSVSVNVLLKALVEEVRGAQRPRPDECSGAPGEVPCDVCAGGRRLRAVKSCLVCLASYCRVHLERHSSTQRLRGHVMVAPLADLDQRACLSHGRALELYCTDEQRCVCALCVEDGWQVVPVETERDRKKAELGNTKNEVQQKIEERERKMEEIKRSAELCQAHIDREKGEVEEVFVALMAAVREAEEEALGPLKERSRQMEREARELTQELQREIAKLRKTISELERIANVEDHVHFLQNYPPAPGPDGGRDWTDVAVDTELAFGTARKSGSAMMAKLELELEKLSSIEIQRIQKFAVDVTLDPDTANPQLVLSDDGREVRHGEVKLDLPDDPGRFDTFGSVLGRNQLTSGRAYWEVDVGDKSGWDLGVASEAANRKGKISLNPNEGYWAIVLYNGDQYGALEEPPVLLSLQEKPQKVGVFVDYEEGLVSFYDVEARSHIYSFTDCTFTEKIYPYFSPHLQQGQNNSGPLVITPVNHTD